MRNRRCRRGSGRSVSQAPSSTAPRDCHPASSPGRRWPRVRPRRAPPQRVTGSERDGTYSTSPVSVASSLPAFVTDGSNCPIPPASPRDSQHCESWRAVREGSTLEPGEAHPPVSLTFRDWREVNVPLVPPLLPRETVQGPGEDDRSPARLGEIREETEGSVPHGRSVRRSGMRLGGRGAGRKAP